MKKHLFLCGSVSRELSALLRAELGPALAAAGGYITETVETPGGAERTLLLPAAAACGVDGFEGRLVYEISDGAARKDNEVFRGEGVRLLQEAAWYPFAVLDRFGGFELVIPQFRGALAELLSSELPLVGVVFGREEALTLGRSLGLGDRFEKLVDRLHEALRGDPETALLSVGAADTENARRLLRQWAQKYVFC